MSYREREITKPNTVAEGWTLHLGKVRNAGNVSAWEPNKLGNFYYGPATYENRGDQLGYNESAKQYLDRWQNFHNTVQNQTVSTSDAGIAKQKPGGITPEIKPRGIRGLFWKPTKHSRVDSYDNFDGDFTGTRSWYYDTDGNEYQILEKQFPAGNTATTELKIKYPNTPMADSTMTITNSNGINKVKNMEKFLPAFEKNFK
jgi:hypothetical protein